MMHMLYTRIGTSANIITEVYASSLWLYRVRVHAVHSFEFFSVNFIDKQRQRINWLSGSV